MGNGPKVISKEVSKEKFTIKVSGIFLENGIIFLFTDSEFRFGSVSVAIPTTTAPLASASLFPTLGGRDEFVSKLLSERLSELSGRTVISIVSFSSYDKEKVTLSLKLSREILEEARGEQV
ncbi:MAG: hypothetical protein ACTSR0_05020 [Candidatus Asgardarchaeia archaeon]